MQHVKTYQDLIVWQKSMELAQTIYMLVKKLPREELFSLSDQIRRAAVSIPSNIAEGQARNSTKEFQRFLAIAKGSKTELETQLLLCVRVGYFTENDISKPIALLHEVGKMIFALSNSLNLVSSD
ncbi:MAG: four helix bundle protein [Planctomycetaceae bacterium]|nr:four helix bundle protein [Planctomycetaceae bacterium]